MTGTILVDCLDNALIQNKMSGTVFPSWFWGC